MVQKQMEGGPKAKAAKAKKAGSKAINALQKAGMNPDGDDETGDIEDAAVQGKKLPRAVVEKMAELKQGGGGDDDADSTGAESAEVPVRPEFGKMKRVGRVEKPQETTPQKKGNVNLSEVLKAMKKKKNSAKP